MDQQLGSIGLSVRSVKALFAAAVFALLPLGAARASTESAPAGVAQPAQPASPGAGSTAGPTAEKPTPAGAQAADKPSKTLTGRATRVAILNFGPPSSWKGEVEDMVGKIVSAKAFKDAIPLLEKDKVDVVVVRINSGGGYALEVPKFHEVFERDYKPRFRTVGWVESAISAAAMSPYVLEEFYFMPEGNLGACTAWSGDLQAAKGRNLEQYLIMMEKASASGKRDSKIMRSMQIQEPLSAEIGEDGRVTFFQNTSGRIIVNPPERVLTLTADQAKQIGFSSGIAATKEDLAKAMGLAEVEWVGEEATKLIDKRMRDNDRDGKRIDEIYGRYNNSLAAARSMQGQKRLAELGVARQRLQELRKIAKTNPIYVDINGLNDEWFRNQEDLIAELRK